jgi:hypothetical protein
MALMINAVIRPADSAVATGDALNPVPALGSEFVLISLSAHCQKMSGECSVNPFANFTLIGRTDAPYQPQMEISGVPMLLAETSIPAETTIYGAIIFEIGQEETDLLLVYESAEQSVETCLAVPFSQRVVAAPPVQPSLPTATPTSLPSPTPFPTQTPPPIPTATPYLTPTPQTRPSSPLPTPTSSTSPLPTPSPSIDPTETPTPQSSETVTPTISPTSDPTSEPTSTSTSSVLLPQVGTSNPQLAILLIVSGAAMLVSLLGYHLKKYGPRTA